jgi:methionyl-tRNA synthetase
VIVRAGLNLVALFARLSRPFIPATAAVIAPSVGDADALDAWPSLDGAAELDRLPPGRPVKAPEVLFRKIEDAQVAEWTERFGGAVG